MSVKPKDFAEATRKSVDTNLPVGVWSVYESYEIKEHEYEGRRYAYVMAPPWRWIEQPTGEYSPRDDQEVIRRVCVLTHAYAGTVPRVRQDT
jgi:hypothetical protein